MAKSKLSQELARAYADRDYWQSFIKNDRWTLLGWSDRSSATFVREGGGVAEVHAAHLELFGFEKYD